MAAIAPAPAPASERPARNDIHTSNAPASGVKKNSASRPPIATTGASSTEKPGAHTGAEADGLSSDGTNPPGVKVFGASGHGTDRTRSLVGCSAPAARASAISA